MSSQDDTSKRPNQTPKKLSTEKQARHALKRLGIPELAAMSKIDSKKLRGLIKRSLSVKRRVERALEDRFEL